MNLLQTFATQSVLAIQNARLFREIEEKSRQIEAANRHKSEFLANMSHELRTPLNAQIIKRTGIFRCRILAYSAAAPFGEEGEIDTNIIESILTADEFEKARRLNWPDQWR